MTSKLLALLGLVMLAGCVDRADGTWAQINVADGSNETAFEHASLTLGVANIELVPCASELARAARWLGDVVLPSAYAHAWDRSVAFSAQETSMAAGDPERALLVLSPAGGRYCEARIALAATAEHASSVAVRGTLDGRAVTMATNLHVDLTSTLDPPLEFHLDALSADLTFVVRPAEWLDGLTAEDVEAGGEAVELQFVRNVARTTSVIVRR
ncbi:MAG: hypothetical protein RMA76_39115 [Deltaproteobacteria bacterium]|jgi:hypothetical protein